MVLPRRSNQGLREWVGLWFAVVLGWGSPGLALEPNRRVSQYNSAGWRSEDGLPQNSVLCIAQTRDGYHWFGTYEGLVRFDGARFTVFDRQVVPELGQEIHALMEDESGVLWVGTSLGLFRYEQGAFRRPPEASELGEAPIKALVADHKSVWILSAVGLARAPVSGKGPWWHAPLPGAPGRTGTSLALNAGGGVWVGTNQGVLRVSEDAVEEIPLPSGVSRQVNGLWAAGDGTLWVATFRGLLSLHEGQFTVYGPDDGLPRMQVTRVLGDRDGNLWMGTARGVVRHTAAGFSDTASIQELSGKWVSSLYEDHDGHLWVGTEGHGVHRLSNGPFISFGEPEGSRLDSFRSVLETQDGTLWMGTNAGGLERVKDGVITRMGPEQGLGNAYINTLAEGGDGALWVAAGSGVWRYDGERFTPLSPKQGLPAGTRVWAMVPEPGGGMWFASSAGLARLSDGRITLHDPQPGFAPEWVSTLFREDSGTIWYGTRSGLVRFAQGTFTRFTPKDGLAGEWVMSLYADPQGALWVGTNRGLSRMKDGRFTSITTAQGLPDETIFTLLLDADGFFWMSNNKGISRVSLRELEEVADGRRQRVNGVLFDERDGMRKGECNGGTPSSAWKTPDGRMWFTNLRGAVMVNPRDERLRLPPPRAHIEELRVQGRPVPVSSRLELSPGQTNLAIRFTAFTPQGDPRVAFRYRLEGHDSDWVEPEGRRVAAYTGLPPGTYRFQVEALDRQGHWVEPGAVLEVRLRPWFYQAAWFYTVCGLVVAGGIYSWQVRRHKQRERWLQARVEERTQALARANEELDANLRSLRSAQAQLVQAGKMAAVGTLAAGVGHEINNPLAYIIGNLEHASEESATLARLADGSVPLGDRLREMEGVLREALMGADRVRRIVRDLSTFSRQDEDTRGPVDVRAVMDLAAKMAAGELRPRARLLRDYVDVPRVEGSEARLAQVFLNLIINAAQALPENKPEENEVRLVLKRGTEGQVVAEVWDTGSGIPPDVLGRIFDPFFTTKPVGVGTGLGLALCQRFVTSMGGRIEVETQVGRGSVFRVILPAMSAQPERAPTVSQAQARDPARGRVLVVDDDPLVGSALRRALSREHDVEVIGSPKRALELLTSPAGDCDVILCDLMMPEMTGMELYDHVEAAAPDRARRMVFITGGAYTPSAKSFLERVRNPRLEKPFDAEKLRMEVSEGVKRARASLSAPAVPA